MSACIYQPIPPQWRAERPPSSLPAVPRHVYIAAGGRCIASYEGFRDVHYASLDNLCADLWLTLAEVLGKALDLDVCASLGVPEETVSLARAGDDEAIDACAEAIYLRDIGKAFPLRELVDLGAPIPEGLKVDASTEGRPIVEDGESWWRPDDHVWGMILAAAAEGHDIGLLTLRVCDQAPGFGTWNM